MGIDATVPFGYESDFLRPVYPIDQREAGGLLHEEGHRNARSRMVGWVNSLSRTGR